LHVLRGVEVTSVFARLAIVLDALLEDRETDARAIAAEAPGIYFDDPDVVLLVVDAAGGEHLAPRVVELSRAELIASRFTFDVEIPDGPGVPDRWRVVDFAGRTIVQGLVVPRGSHRIQCAGMSDRRIALVSPSALYSALPGIWRDPRA
jgi:hypothetical protein